MAVPDRPGGPALGVPVADVAGALSSLLSRMATEARSIEDSVSQLAAGTPLGPVQMRRIQALDRLTQELADAARVMALVAGRCTDAPALSWPELDAAARLGSTRQRLAGRADADGAHAEAEPVETVGEVCWL